MRNQNIHHLSVLTMKANSWCPRKPKTVFFEWLFFNARFIKVILRVRMLWFYFVHSSESAVFFFGQHCIERTDAISFKKTSFAPFCTKVPRMDLSGWAIILARPKFMIMAARGAWLRAAGSTVFFWEETNDNGFRISCVQSFCNWIYLNWILCDKCSYKSSDIKNPKYET